MNLSLYPRIVETAESMARSNGVINRREPVAVFHDKLAEIMETRESELQEVETWLEGLSPEDRETFADGEDKEIEKLEAPESASALFDDVFDVM